MTIPGKTYIKVHHAGEVYLIQDDASGRRAAHDIEAAGKAGGSVTFDHEAGTVTIDFGHGEPPRVEYVD